MWVVADMDPHWAPLEAHTTPTTPGRSCLTPAHQAVASTLFSHTAPNHRPLKSYPAHAQAKESLARFSTSKPVRRPLSSLRPPRCPSCSLHARRTGCPPSPSPSLIAVAIAHRHLHLQCLLSPFHLARASTRCRLCSPSSKWWTCRHLHCPGYSMEPSPVFIPQLPRVQRSAAQRWPSNSLRVMVAAP